MKKTLCLLFLITQVSNIYTQEISSENINKISPVKVELGLTGSLTDLAFPTISLDLAIQFYKKGISSLAFRISPFVFIKGNHFVAPNFLLVGGLFELQYRIHASNGVFFAIETGFGPGSEIFIHNVYSVDKGFHKAHIDYGLFSVAIKLGGYKAFKENQYVTTSFMIGYRLQFPFNLKFTHIFLTGISISFDTI